MLNKRIKSLLNQQINSELYSAYLYHNIQLQFKDLGLAGFAKWYELQASEEVQHAARLEKYLEDNNEKVILQPIDIRSELPCDVTGLLQLAAEQEQRVTSEIHLIYNSAMEYGDIRTMNFLNWFLSEQLEEEANADNNLKLTQKYATCGGGLLEVDRRMGAR